jgi:hypothetical protein
VAIVSTGEAITYLSGRLPARAHLAHHVRRASQALERGGLFVFDAIVHTRGRTMAYRSWHEVGHRIVLVETREDARRHHLTRMIVVLSTTPRSCRRIHERHRVGVYDRAAVVTLLRAHGFTARVLRGYGRVPLLPRRLLFVARRV